MDALSITPTGAGSSRAGCIGSVKDVIAGRMPQTLDGVVFDARTYRYGFLLGSPRDKYSLGETVVVNGLCYATSTDRTTSEYNTTIYGARFVTSGMFLIPLEAKPSHTAILSTGADPVRLVEVFSEMYHALDHPFAFVGLVECAELHGAAIGKAPIDGLNIFDNDKEYYPFPASRLRSVPAFVVGALTDYTRTGQESLNKQLESVLYRTPHPGDSQVQPITSHAHALTLRKPVSTMSDITPSTVDRVLHVLSDTTTITSARLDIFTLSALENMSPLDNASHGDNP